jgi:arginine decarboxylase
MTAYASVLVVDVIGSSRFDGLKAPEGVEAQARSSEDTPQPVLDLLHALDTMEESSAIEILHDATQAREEVMSLFSLGYVPLPMRALCEGVYWRIGATILSRVERELGEGETLPEEIEALRDQLSDIYFCNFSVFQSAPDSWAIDQIFPVCPLHRLDEKPTRRGVLADITCDSDGKIDRFPDQADVKRSLELHELREGERYDLGIFLVGAYQEILGDLHNLLGDTNAAHVTVDDEGQWRIDEVIAGDAVADVMGYVQIDAKQLRRSMRRSTEDAVRSGRLSVAESRTLLSFYEAGLEGYTYLED